MLTVTCCAAQDLVQFKLQLSSSLWKLLCYPAPMVSIVAVRPRWAEFSTHTQTHTDGGWDWTTWGPLIWPIPCHIIADTLPLWSLVARNFFHLYGVIILAPLRTPASPLYPTPPLCPRAVLQFCSLQGPAAAAGTGQVAIELNEPKLSPLVKCSHLTHLEPGGVEGWRGPCLAGMRPLQGP